MPQQRIRVITTGSEEKDRHIVITVSEEDAEKLNGLDRWVKEEKKAKRTIAYASFEPEK